jgi:toxin ParE1/3/4
MAHVIISSPADADTDYILADLASKAGRRVAAKYDALFENLYDRLADSPDIGPPRPSLGANVRIGIVAPYIVIYEHAPAADLVTVLRIVHGRRRITGKLLLR